MGTVASFSGTVQADPAVVPAEFTGTIAGFVDSGFVDPGFVDLPPPTFTGTVDRTRIDAYDGELTYVGVRVVLDGVEIPAGDFVAPVELSRSIDSHLASATLRLAGERWSLHRTRKTWTLTPVQIYFRQRQAGGPPQEEIRLDGLVRTCRETNHEGEPALEVSVEDLTARYRDWRPCHEVPPYSGLNRGEIVEEVLSDAGIQVDVPPGARYDAPVQLDGPKLFQWLWEWGEPEGWHWRWEGSTLTAYVPVIKEPPQPPDHVWGPGDIDTLQSEPPQDVPSRWSVHGYAALFVDEIGIETEFTRTEIKGLYAPIAAAERQLSDGSRDPVSGWEQTEALRTVQIIEDTVRRRGNLELGRSVRELGYYNVATAKGTTVLGPGQSGDGWDYTTSYIDSEGRFVYYPVERFGEVGLREEIPSHDAQGTKLSAVERVHRLFRKTQGIRATGSGPGDPTVAGVGIGDDDQSYQILQGTTRIEEYGLAEEYRRAFQHHPESGAALQEEQEEYRHYEPRMGLDVAGGFRLYNGEAQQDLTAQFIHVATRSKRNILSADARLLGVVELGSGYAALQKHDGAHDFGGAYSSNEPIEQFRALSRKNVAYIVRGHNQVEEVTFDEDGRTSRIILGSLPVPGFLESPWTRLVQQPLELVIDDPVLEEWFGIRAESIDNEYIQNEAEALAVYRARRRRALARKLQIERAETLVRPGDTVLVLWPPIIAERYLLTEERLTRDPVQGAASATYSLEAPL